MAKPQPPSEFAITEPNDKRTDLETTNKESQTSNKKTLQNVNSNVNIHTTKRKYIEIRSKSQEELTTSKIKRRTLIKDNDMQKEITEWLEIHGDKLNFQQWSKKLQKLALKLQVPGEEERLQRRIEKFLEKAPDCFSDGDEETREFRKQLPKHIVKKLKKMYLKPSHHDVDVYRIEMPRYYSRCKIDHLKKILTIWLKKITIKKKDFLGRVVKKENILRYMTECLEPLVLDRPKSDLEYKIILQNNITNIVNDLPMIYRGCNKENYLNNLIETLVNEIIGIDGKIPTTYIQPTISEIKHFVEDEITFFLERSRSAISTRRVEYLEKELIDHLLDLTNIENVDETIIKNIQILLTNIAKLNEEKAKYYTKIIVNDYKEFFFRQHYFTDKENEKIVKPDVTSAVNIESEINETDSLEVYTKLIKEEIVKWFSKVKIPMDDENIKEVTVNNLTNDIVERRKYMQINSNAKNTDACFDDSDYLKYLLFQRTYKLVEKSYPKYMDQISELVVNINSIPVPSLLPSKSIVLQITTEESSALDERKSPSYLEILTDELCKWFQNLPKEIYSLEDIKMDKQLIAPLVENIQLSYNKKSKIIDKVIDEWITKAFNKKLSCKFVVQLQNLIRNVLPFPEYKVQKDPKQEKILIRQYEDIIDEWMDTIPLKSKSKDLFTNNRNELLHELALDLYNIKMVLKESPNIEKKLHESILDWMKIVPLRQESYSKRDIYAIKLSKLIQSSEIDESIETKNEQNEDDCAVNKMETATLNWLKNVSLYKNYNVSNEKCISIMKELANKLENAIKSGDTIDDKIIDYINRLDTRQSIDVVYDTALELKQYLIKLNIIKGTLPNIDNDNRDKELILNNPKNKVLTDKIDMWLTKLPLNIPDPDYFDVQKKMFIEKMNEFISQGATDELIQAEVVKFLKILPIAIDKRLDESYLESEANKLVQSVTKKSNIEDQTLNTEDAIAIGDTIRNWVAHLPIKTIHNSLESQSIIDESVGNIIKLLLSNQVQNCDEKIREELMVFFSKFTLGSERLSEYLMSILANDLIRNLKNLNIHTVDDITNTCKHRPNIAVYGISVKNTTDGFTNRSIKPDDSPVNTDLDVYTRQVIQQINHWLEEFNLLQNHNESIKDVVINDLAGDIVDRFKYLELSPQSRGTPEEELEHLKYQIFKWINKLTGDHNADVVIHADELMKKIKSIPAPMSNKPPNNEQNIAKVSGNTPITREIIENLPTYGPNKSGGSLSYDPPNSSFNRISCPAKQGNPGSPKLKESLTKEDIFIKYQKVFKEKVYELPIDTPTPDSAQLAELARTGMYNGIIKTFFRLKSESEFENDDGYFELILEDKLDEMLDILPQTEAMRKFRHGWKLDVLSKAMEMRNQLQDISDRPSFKQRLKDGFNRKFAKNFEMEQCFMLQHGFLTEMAEAFILKSKYEEEDPIKANIYKQRLMKRIDEMANHLTKQHNVDFRFLKKPQLAQRAMRILEDVPIPKDDIMKEEVEEILLAQEIELWYKELPTKPYLNNFDQVFRRRMIDVLAKKLYEIENNENELDISKEKQMKHEMSRFLTERGKLEKDQDLNINFMVDELNNRIKNRKSKDTSGYEGFEANKPACSTFAKLNNNEILAPLIDDAATPGGPFLQQGSGLQNILEPNLGDQSRSSVAMEPFLKQKDEPYNVVRRSMSPGPNLNSSRGTSYQWPGQPSSQYPPTSSPRAEVRQAGPQEDPTQPSAPLHVQLRSPPGLSNQSNLNSYQSRPTTPNQGQIQDRLPTAPDGHTNPLHPSQGDPYAFTQPGVSSIGLSQPINDAATNSFRPGTYPIKPSDSVNKPRSPNLMRRDTPWVIHIEDSEEDLEEENTNQNEQAERPRLTRRETIHQSREKQMPLEPDRGIESQKMVGIPPPHQSPQRNLPERDQNFNHYHRNVSPKQPQNRGPSPNYFAEQSMQAPGHGGRPAARAAISQEREDEVERVFVKCKCMERYRRRRVCIDSFPCPSLKAPCRYFY